MAKRFLFIVNNASWFISHRLPIALRLQKIGYEVHVAAANADRELFDQHDIRFHALSLSRGGINPVKELRVMLQMFRLIRHLRPNCIHLVTLKPVLYGCLAARVSGIDNVVAAVAGLGSSFIGQSLRSKFIQVVMRILFRLSLSGFRGMAIFQNESDRDVVLKLSGLNVSQTAIIRGSGVDISRYPVKQEPMGKIIVSMASRLLADKGVVEFVEAGNILTNKGYDTEFWLIGESDHENPASMRKDSIFQLIRGCNCKLLGYRTDIAELYSKSNIVVLPSYREGLPKSLVEAAACGRAVVTTDVPGCRDAIEPDETGLLVPVRDAEGLAVAIERLIKNTELRHRMGKAGRRLAENEFMIEIIVDAHIAVYRKLGECV